jgi:hypothetical protein
MPFAERRVRPERTEIRQQIGDLARGVGRLLVRNTMNDDDSDLLFGHRSPPAFFGMPQFRRTERWISMGPEALGMRNLAAATPSRQR